MAIAPMVSLLKAYSLPLVLFSLAIFFQLFVLPTTFPPSHYDVLGIKPHSSIEEVREAYEKITSDWNSSKEALLADDFIKVRYAFELLTNPLWKRDYDIFGIDEQLHIMEKVKEKHGEESFSKVDLPLLDGSSDLSGQAFNALTSEMFQSTILSTGARLIQVYSSGSKRCADFLHNWKRIVSFLDGVGSTSTVELGEVQLALYLAEKKSMGQPFFRNGLPSLVAFAPGCKSLDCLMRYQGDLSVDAVTDWFATTILGLPRILYYKKESLGPNFIAKSGSHKVKVMFFSKTGERAAPFIRQAGRDYWAYASFAFVLWQEEDSSFWWNNFEVETAPAVVFLKSPGIKPTVIHGTFNSSSFLEIMEQNKHQDIPQLRSITSEELGCDARGYSRAGKETMTWYCVILAGRQSIELNRLRETVLKVQNTLSDNVKLPMDDDKKTLDPLPAAVALKEKRLTFTWLDGEAQKNYCFFYLHSQSSYDTCGPRRDITDVPQLLIVRYQRNSTEDERKVEKKPKTIWDQFQEDDQGLASQLVATYNGSADIQQIIQWVSQIVQDGDSTNLPFFRIKSPDLVPEDADPIWSKGAQSVLSTSKGMKQRIHNMITGIYDSMGDPRVGPILLLGACLSFGSIWLSRSQAIKTNQTNTEERSRPERKKRSKRTPKNGQSSTNDNEVKDADNCISSNSDSE